MITFHIITIFPEIFDSYLNESILKRAQEDKKVKFEIYNLRDFAEDKHKIVDDTPYGGGPGMVLKVEPIYKCVEQIKQKAKSKPTSPMLRRSRKLKVILTSAKGEEYTQRKAEELKEYTDIIIICGRYEGVDERVAKRIADEEISIGRYVLTGGELPAMIIADSITRLIPEVLGNEESLDDSKFKIQNSKFSKDYPVYTRPEIFNDWEVPEILLSGNHEEIKNWREGNNS